MVALFLFALLTLKTSFLAAQNSQWAPLEEDNTGILDVPGRDDAKPGWADSYSIGDRCYCQSTFDHNIGNVTVETVLGNLTVLQVCKLLEEAGQPSAKGRPRYNDIQCGNGPANDAGDETPCPGRVEYGAEGCAYIGPTWKLDGFLNGTAAVQTNQPTPPLLLPTAQPSMSPRETQKTDAPTSANASSSIIPTVLNATSSPRPTALSNNARVTPLPTALSNNATVTPLMAPTAAPTAFTVNETVTMDAPTSAPSPAPTTTAPTRVSPVASSGNSIRGAPSAALVAVVMMMVINCLLY